MPKACVVIPTKNEAATIASVIAEVRKGFLGTRYDDIVVLVVDDSTDATRQVALDNGAVVVRGDGDGLGAAMFKGLKSAVGFDPDVIVAVDGDGQADAAAEIPRFLAPIDNGSADMVLGSRFLESNLVDYHYRWVNRFGTRVLSGFLRSQTGLDLTDSHGGIRAMVPEVAADLEMLGTHTYVQETIIDAVEKGYRVTEIASVWRVRQHGKSRVVGSIPRYVFYTLPILILRSGQHIRWLYTAGIVCMLLAVLTFLGLVVDEGIGPGLFRRITGFIFIAVMALSGMQMFFFGFVLQLLKQIKKNQDRLTRRTSLVLPKTQPATIES